MNQQENHQNSSQQNTDRQDGKQPNQNDPNIKRQDNCPQDINPQYQGQRNGPQGINPQYQGQWNGTPQGHFPEMNGMPDAWPPEVLTKEIISQSGIALFIMGIAVLLAELLIELLATKFCPAVLKSDWYVWAVTAFRIIVIALPLFYLLTKRIPNSSKGRVIKLKPSHFIGLFFICTAAMYITNFFSVFLTFLIAIAKGESFRDINPLTDIFTGSNFILTLLYASIAAPIVEELIFRKLLLDKLRRYGDVPAILMTGFAFGLFHMNLSQFFYATALGIIFAYITIRTNTIRYSILLHIMINFIGSAITPFAANENLMVSLIIVIWVFSAITVGGILFAVNVKNIKLQRPVQPLKKKSDYFLNTGTILYTLMCLVIIAVVTLS